MKALSGFYYVQDNEGEVYQCRARGVFRKNKQTPLVGDYVEFEAANKTDGTVTRLLSRKNALIRPPVSNVDQALIAVSVKEPDFSTVLLDRFLVLVEKHLIEPVILFTKMDLLEQDEKNQIAEYRKIYEAMGYVVKEFSTALNYHSESLAPLLVGKTTVIAGQSGVGKSSFLNQLNPELQIKTAEISNSLGRGKHTTRHVELVPILGGHVADTPGFSSLEFTDIDLEELPKLFVDFEMYSEACKFRGCMHMNEPKCRIKEAVDAGEIAKFRYDHYQQFYEEIKQRKPRY
ncbi:putative ribosome biogenesis GTPase RsgA 2 [Halolactibacillus alkaliphilus]|uniref:Small ribosomal subunit biogenesis GTPase RsgA n=2 Tax=Halolactibacillus alkaliphilus TaxID=442899 RepID=A0A511WX86_9BACI|nr:putative ribosome biogenesis GTPase RsgA 2 [Halolactibacillus alkaliphilus]GGN65180.1 putative ribosome biogenesis GTPase RsgA 2 [Halolactibacillus alkaliphilus]SFO64175.1 ribosome biogenesis GTPase [Halolactibacillus alkaliphilus]